MPELKEFRQNALKEDDDDQKLNVYKIRIVNKIILNGIKPFFDISNDWCAPDESGDGKQQ